MTKRGLYTVAALLLSALMIGITAQTAAQDEEATPEITPETTPEPVDILERYAGIPHTRLEEDGAFILGEDHAALTVVVFSDFLCGECAEYSQVEEQFIETYVSTGQARLEYRMYPVNEAERSSFAARLAECAGEQMRFWEARRLLFDVGDDAWGEGEVGLMVAEELELEYDEFATCLEDAEQFITDSLLAIELNVLSSPAVMFRIGDSSPQWVRVRGQVFSQGGLPFELLELVVRAVVGE